LFGDPGGGPLVVGEDEYLSLDGEYDGTLGLVDVDGLDGFEIELVRDLEGADDAATGEFVVEFFVRVVVDVSDRRECDESESFNGSVSVWIHVFDPDGMAKVDCNEGAWTFGWVVDVVIVLVLLLLLLLLLFWRI
jgi:hypothetical protein